MKRLVIFAAVMATACVHPVISDPHAVAPTYDRWQATVSGAPSAVFDVAMRVLADSSYRIADARKDAGVITTDYRKPSEVQRGAQQLKTLALSTNDPTRLSLVILPIGSDSTRLTISGDYEMQNIGATNKLTAAEGDHWKLARGIGEAILVALSGSGR